MAIRKINNNIEKKKEFLLKNNIALWDVIKTCEITGSSDSSIKNAIPNDIEDLITKTNIEIIFCNGNTSYNLFIKYFKDKITVPVICLPSSSPANAKFSLDDLTKIWREKIEKNYED